MFEQQYPTLFGSVPARFESDFSRDESVRRLAAVVRQSFFDGLFEHCAIGWVSDTGVTVQRATPWSRRNRLLFKGSFQVEADRVVLVGCFRWPRMIQVTTGLYMTFCLILAAFAGLAALGGEPIAALVSAVGFGIVALLWFSPWFTRKDVPWISDVITDALQSTKRATRFPPAAADNLTRRGSRAMVIVQILLALAAIAAVASALSGVAAVAVIANALVIIRHDAWSRSAAMLAAVLCAAGFFGIGQRWSSVWRVGMVALPLGGVIALVQLIWLIDLQLPPNQPPQLRWFVIIFMSFGMTAVAAFWTLWWKRQREYFETTDFEKIAKE